MFEVPSPGKKPISCGAAYFFGLARLLERTAAGDERRRGIGTIGGRVGFWYYFKKKPDDYHLIMTSSGRRIALVSA